MNEEILKEMVDDSYSLVVSKLTKKQKEELKLHNNKQEIFFCERQGRQIFFLCEQERHCGFNKAWVQDS